ncbi:MerR family transcriptional regulator [Streptomyces adustus]|uniref:MerR family transcriptional regulator n=1 Tax=Streptomyces adustus TaxID=1609272 RepID=UPI0035DA581D
MRIGDAAAAGTTPRAPRFHEERGLLSAPPRTASGQRRYGPDDVARLRVIRELLGLGLTVEDLRVVADRSQLLAENPHGPAPSAHRARRARVWSNADWLPWTRRSAA